MKLNKAIMAIFAFSLFITAINSAGLFDSKLPVSDGMGKMSAANVTELTRVEQTTGGNGFIDSVFGGIGFLTRSLSVLEQILLSIFNVDKLLTAYGIPPYIVTLFYSMLILITVLGVMKLILNRNDKGIE